MSRDSDDDALSWAGDDDRGLAPGWTPVGGQGAFVDEPPTAEGIEPAEGPDEAPVDGHQTGSAALVGFGILGGIYLLYAIGWAVTAGRSTAVSADVVGRFMSTVGLWLAVLAPVGWYLLVIMGRARVRTRLLLLILGAIVLVPLPFLLGIGVNA